jgi:solute carrier family 9 (sodium/hydrogen exchanger), member 8
MLIGLLFSLALTLYFKRAEHSDRQEVGLIMLTSYFCYLTAELLDLSGVIALFVCGIVMGSVCVLNTSPSAQRGIGLVFETTSYLAEGLIYTYIGFQILLLRNADTKILVFSALLLPLMPLCRLLALLPLLLV